MTVVGPRFRYQPSDNTGEFVEPGIVLHVQTEEEVFEKEPGWGFGVWTPKIWKYAFMSESSFEKDPEKNYEGMYMALMKSFNEAAV